jgi:hypothetical protein
MDQQHLLVFEPDLASEFDFVLVGDSLPMSVLDKTLFHVGQGLFSAPS